MSLTSVETDKITQSMLSVTGPELQRCEKDALTGLFGWFFQAILAGLAFTCLILKRFCEPPLERRPWLIWFYDTSKQGMGALVVHFANIFLASQFHGDPCTWYVISFLLDSSVGLFIIYVGIRVSQYLARRNQWDAIYFGEYGKPPSVNAWMAQCCLYLLLMVVEKILITMLIQLDFWDDVRDFILSPITNPDIELALVVLIIPFFINALMFWVTDNFLMIHYKHNSGTGEAESNLSRRVMYRKRESQEDSESDVLLSGDDELLGTNEDLQSALEDATLVRIA